MKTKLTDAARRYNDLDLMMREAMGLELRLRDTRRKVRMEDARDEFLAAMKALADYRRALEALVERAGEEA